MIKKKKAEGSCVATIKVCYKAILIKSVAEVQEEIIILMEESHSLRIR